MDLGLTDKVAVVTGGSRGIGRSIAATLVAEGARVMLVSRKEESLREAAEAIGGDVRWCAANVGDDDAGAQCSQSVELGERDDGTRSRAG